MVPTVVHESHPRLGRFSLTVYAPPGIGEQAVYDHLQDIQANVLLVAPEGQVELLEV